MPQIPEREWVRQIVPLLQEELSHADLTLMVEDGRKLPYSHEVRSYSGDDPHRVHGMRYETDLLISERMEAGSWVPRVVVEAKLRTVTTHDAITYSQKAAMHKQVHPYLRYGIFLGARGHYPLPGRLFRNGAHFDFMLSWRGLEPDGDEMRVLIELLLAEAAASRKLEEIVFNSRSRGRAAYTVLHRPLDLRGVAAPSLPTGHSPTQTDRARGARAKYEPLREYLAARQSQPRVQMTFSEIAAVIGSPLPRSAFMYREWWSNQTNTANRPQAAAWIDAGFRVASVHQEADGGRVEFERAHAFPS